MFCPCNRAAQVRDIFLFCCFTGLAYADVKKLRRWEIVTGVDGEKWLSDTNRYKLSDFEEEEIGVIFKKYKAILEEITGKKTSIYRAGGWCLQPFSKIKKAFLDLSTYNDV